MFWSKSADTADQQRSDLKLRPNEGLSCRLSSLFGEGSNLFAPIQGSRQIFTTPSEASELYFSNDTIKAQKCEYSSSQLLSWPCERGSGAHFVSIKCPHSDLCASSQSLTKDHGGKDACKELDYAVKAGSRRRIWRIQVMWRSDFSRFNTTPPAYEQDQDRWYSGWTLFIQVHVSFPSFCPSVVFLFHLFCHDSRYLFYKHYINIVCKSHQSLLS